MQQTAGVQTFWQTDALGSVRGQSNSAQTPTGEVYYDAFGLPSLRQGQTPGPQGWAAAANYQTDADSGLMLLGSRHYDPTIGRFLSQDPAGDGDNWYAYCDNDPLDWVDPTGLSLGGYGPDIVVDGMDIGNGAGARQLGRSVADSNVGYWDNGPPTGSVKGQPTVMGGERETHWIWTDDPFQADALYGIGGYFQLITARGNVGHTQGNEELENEIKRLKTSLNQGGYTPEERKVFDKEIKALETKIKTNEKAQNQRGHRFSITIPQFNPAAVPSVTPSQGATAGGTAGTTIAILILLKILTGPLPIP